MALYKCTYYYSAVGDKLCLNTFFTSTVIFSCLKDAVISVVCSAQSPTKKPQVAERTRKVGFYVAFISFQLQYLFDSSAK